MGIVRVRKQENFVVMDKTGLEDERLSFKGKGLLSFLLSKPNNWTAKIYHLKKVSQDGRSSVMTGLQELEDYGYLYRNQERDENGHFKEMECVIYENPKLNPHYNDENSEPEQTPDNKGISPDTEKPNTDYPNTENPNSQLIKNELTTNDLGEDDIREIKNEFEKTFGKQPGNNQIKMIGNYISKLSIELIKHAFKKCRINCAGTVKYLMVILEDWSESGIQTISGANKHIKEHNDKSFNVRGSNKFKAEEDDEEIESNISDDYFDNIRNKLK